MKNITVISLLKERTKNTPDKTVICQNGRDVSWKELKKLSDVAANDFIKLGISPKSKVGIYSVNSLQWIVSYLALVRIGALPILVNYNYKKNELEDIIAYSDVEYLLYGDGFKGVDFRNLVNSMDRRITNKLKSKISIGESRLEVWDSLLLTRVNTKQVDKLEAIVKPDDDLNMIFTSGTTARVKGIVLSHYQMLNVSRIQAAKLHWNERDVVCLPLPFFHCFGLSCGLFAALNVNVKLCLATTRSHSILKIIEKYKCTVLSGVPSMFRALMNSVRFDDYDITSLKSGIIAGSRVSDDDFIKISEKCHIPNLQQSYGQTEASPAITFTDYDSSLEERSKTVGKVMSEIQMRIYKNDENTSVPAYEVGEVQIRGFNVVKDGYYKLPEESKNLYTNDGWLRTGDMGYIDKKENLHITGRLKEMIIRCGENICPYEIEETIMKYGDVVQVKVIGIPDDFTGESIVAVYMSENDLNMSKLYSFLKRNLSDYKIPEYFIKIDNFPLRENGKINTKEINKIVLNELTGGKSDGIKSTAKTN